MAARIGPDRGSAPSGPLRIRDFGPRDTRGSEKEDFAVIQNPQVRTVLPLLDFVGAQETYDLEVSLTTDGGVHEQATTGDNVGYVRVPRAGRLISAQYTAEDALAANDTNYLTFSVTNKLGSGSGSTAMLAATDANTTKATGGTAITAVAGRSLTVHGTAANKYVAEGDVLLVTEAVTGTLANATDKPKVVLRFATIPRQLTPLIARTAGSPLVGPVDAVANGEITGVLSATDEVNTAAVYQGDKVDLIASYGPILRARAKFGTIAANERAILGLCDAYNATWDNIAKHAWFRLDGDMVLDAETDDGTTDDDDNPVGITLVAGTYYEFAIDMSDLGNIKFHVDDRPPLKLAASALASTDILQFVIAVQKASGTGVPSWTLDYAFAIVART